MNPLLHRQSTFYSRREVVSDFQRQTDPEAAPGPPVKGDAVSTLMDVSERFMLKGRALYSKAHIFGRIFLTVTFDCLSNVES